jgi:hypothetical protein
VTAVPQHMQALERANRIRLGRSALKRDVAAGRVAVVDVIADCPECARSMTVFDLLAAQRRWGDVKARTTLKVLGVSEAYQVGSLSPRQVGLLRQLLGPKS